MKNLTLTLIISLIIGISLSPLSAAGFGSATPNGDTFNTTSITCSVTALSVDPGESFFFAYDNDELFTSSTTVTLVEDTDYTVTGTRADISYLSISHFIEGENNWYRWGAKIGGTLTWAVSSYRVIVTANQAPVVTIIQPDNTGIAGTNTVFEVLLEDEGIGIDETSIIFNLADASGASVFSFTGNGQSIFNASTGKISYTHPGLLDGAQYTLSVSATDAGYRSPFALTTSKTAVFAIKSGAIVDLVPVPSPFDPGRESSTIQYTLSSASGDVEINIYDMSSRFVRTIVRGVSRPAGENTVDTWDGKDFNGQSLANGIYFIEVISDSNKKYSSIILMKK